MGYTHYWTTKGSFPTRRWAKIMEDAQKLFAAAPMPLTGCITGIKPDVAPEGITFNGAAPNDYETFCLANDKDRAFCKTDRNPYDLMVCAILIVAYHHNPANIVVTSDGGMCGTIPEYPGPHDKEWDDALAFVNRILGVSYKLPPLITHRSIKEARAKTATSIPLAAEL